MPPYHIWWIDFLLLTDFTFQCETAKRDIHPGKFNIWTKMSGAVGVGINTTERLNNVRLTMGCSCCVSIWLCVASIINHAFMLCQFQWICIKWPMDHHDDAHCMWIILNGLTPSDGICHSWRLARYCASSNRPNIVWISILRNQNFSAKRCWIMCEMN